MYTCRMSSALSIICSASTRGRLHMYSYIIMNVYIVYHGLYLSEVKYRVNIDWLYTYLILTIYISYSKKLYKTGVLRGFLCNMYWISMSINWKQSQSTLKESRIACIKKYSYFFARTWPTRFYSITWHYVYIALSHRVV